MDVDVIFKKMYESTYIIIFEVIVHLQLIQTNGALERVDEGALRDGGVGPHIHRHILHGGVLAPLAQVVRTPAHDQRELLGNENTRLHDARVREESAKNRSKTRSSGPK